MQIKSIIETTNEYFDDYFNFITSFIELREEEILSGNCNDCGLYNKTLSYIEESDSEIQKIIQLTYTSLILSVSVFTEARLVDLCIHLEQKNNQIFTHKDLKGVGTTRAINYINKILGISFPIDNKTRSNFNIFWEVRNSLIHNEGILKKDKVILIKKFIADNPDILSIDSNDKIQITSKYATFAISLNRQICDEILNIYKK